VRVRFVQNALIRILDTSEPLPILVAGLGES
jgi:hypothetical protein